MMLDLVLAGEQEKESPIIDAGYPPELADYIKRFSGSIDALMEDLKAERVDLEDWRDTFARLLASYIAISYLAGSDQTSYTGDSQIWLAGWLATQLDYLNGFRDAISANRAAGGGWSNAWPVRAQLYSGSLVTPFWYGETEGLPLPALPGDGSSECGQADACGWEIIWLDEENGDADCYWLLNQKRHAKVHCQQCIERSKKWAPLQVREWKLVLPEYAVSTLEWQWDTRFKHLPGRHDQKTHGQRGQQSVTSSISNPSNITDQLTSNPIKSNDDPNRPRGAFFSEKIAVSGDGDAIMKKNETISSGVSTNIDAKVEYEAGAYEISRECGLDIVPATVLRPHPEYGTVSLQSFVNDAHPPSQKLYFQGDDKDWPHITDNRDFGKMALLDMITGNIDRHEGNFLIKDGQLVAIDHGIAFVDLKKDKRRIQLEDGGLGYLLTNIDNRASKAESHMRRYGDEKEYSTFQKKKPARNGMDDYSDLLPISRGIKNKLSDSIKSGGLRKSLSALKMDADMIDAVVARAQVIYDHWDRWFIEE